MTRDLHDLLTEAAPEPREEVDVEAVLDRGVQLGRRRALALAAAVVVALAGTAGVVTQLIGDDPAPIIDQHPGEEAAPEPGTYGDGAVVVAGPGRVPEVDLSVEARITGEVVATVEADPDELAVAGDRALGITAADRTMRIVRDGEELARVDLEQAVAEELRTDEDPDPLELQPSRPVFAPDGSVWTLVPLSFDPEDMTVAADVVVVGLDRDGTVTTARVTANGTAVLRTSALGVSVVTLESDGMPMFDATRVVTTPAVGADAPAELTIGAQPDDTFRPQETSQENTLLQATHFGRRAVQLVADRGVWWQDIETGLSVRGSQAVAGDRTAVLRTAVPDRDGYELPGVLVVADEDGTTAVALLPEDIDQRRSPGLGVLVSPDGAVHVTTPGIGRRVEIRTLLDAALRPVGPIAGATRDGAELGVDGDVAQQLAAAAAFEPPVAWRETTPTDGQFAEVGHPGLEVAEPSGGDPSPPCAADRVEPCLRVQRQWELRPDDGGPSPVTPAEVDAVAAAIADTPGWELVHEPDCIPGLDISLAAEPVPPCTWEADVDDAYVLVELGRDGSTQPWQLTLTAQLDGYFQRPQESPVAIIARRDLAADLLAIADRIDPAGEWRLGFDAVRGDPPACMQLSCLSVHRGWFGIDEVTPDGLERRLVAAGVSVHSGSGQTCGLSPYFDDTNPVPAASGTTANGGCVQLHLTETRGEVSVDLVAVAGGG